MKRRFYALQNYLVPRRLCLRSLDNLSASRTEKARLELGADVTIDRGALGPTVIGKGTKIDNLVQIAHNVKIGEHCIVVSQAGIAGSTQLGKYTVLGGQVGLGRPFETG